MFIFPMFRKGTPPEVKQAEAVAKSLCDAISYIQTNLVTKTTPEALASDANPDTEITGINEPNSNIAAEE